MKLLSYHDGDAVRGGILVGDLVQPLRRDCTLLDVIRAGLPVDADRWLAGDDAVPLASVRLAPPYLPPTVRDFVAFEEHVEGAAKSMNSRAEVVAEWYQAPTFYFTNPYAIIGSGADVRRPDGCELLDFELEIGVVVGQSGSGLTPEQGREHIFGLTVFNDWSARDLQRREMRVSLGPAKGKDFATTVGPVIVTLDEFAERFDSDGFLDLGMTVSVNGVEVGRDLLSNMGWSLGSIVAYASRDTWVHAGDLLGSGTCGNGGCLAELWGRSGQQVPPPLQPGDVVSMGIEGIGSLSNTIVQGKPQPVVPEARPSQRNRPSDTQLNSLV